MLFYLIIHTELKRKWKRMWKIYESNNIIIYITGNEERKRKECLECDYWLLVKRCIKDLAALMLVGVSCF